jgi:hypothetical protein
LGGYGSGRSGGRPIADQSFRIDIAWMIRAERAKPGCQTWGSLNWSRGGDRVGSISYEADMTDPDNARLVLKYTRGSGDDAEKVRQIIQLTYSQPHFGGRRWWMICPYGGGQCGKLYLPGNGDRFASRKAWRLGYQSQRIAERDRPFEALFRLQRRVGGEQGFEAGLGRRPKGMWHRTYEQMWRDYERLEERCAVEMMGMMARLGRT